MHTYERIAKTVTTLRLWYVYGLMTPQLLLR